MVLFRSRAACSGWDILLSEFELFLVAVANTIEGKVICLKFKPVFITSLVFIQNLEKYDS